MANAIKKWLLLLLVLSMIVLLLAAAPAAFAQTVEMGYTIEICDNNERGFEKCTKYCIDYNMDLYAWGYNADGNVGNGTTDYQATPCKILSNIVSIKAGARVAGALTADGDLYMWGFFLGLEPRLILENVKVFAVSSPCITYAITDNGDLYYMSGTGSYNNPQAEITGVSALEIGPGGAYAKCASGNYFNGTETSWWTKMNAPARFKCAVELNAQQGKDIFYNNSPGIGSYTPEGITFTKSGNLYYNSKLIMTNVHSYRGDVNEMYFLTKSGELYFGSIANGYCYKMAEGIAMFYKKLEVGTKPGSGSETKVYLQVLDGKPTGSFDNFKKVNSYPEGKFTDVAATDWFAESVKEAYELDLVKGASDTNFNPSGNITAAEAIALAARLHSIYCHGEADFVQGTPWYQVYLDYALANHITNTYSFQHSDYNEPINRREFAWIFASAFPEDENTLSKINNMPDGAIPDVNSTQGFIYILYRAGVLTGNDEHGTYAPYSNIKRSEVAAIVTRMAEPELRKHFALK